MFKVRRKGYSQKGKVEEVSSFQSDANENQPRIIRLPQENKPFPN